MELLGRMHPLSVRGTTFGGATDSMKGMEGQMRCPRPLMSKESTHLQ